MVEKLRQLKEKSHMTNQQIAEKSNIPESTVARIFSGKTPNPTIATAVSMAKAMGGSAADFFNEEDGGRETADSPEPAKADEGTAPERMSRSESDLSSDNKISDTSTDDMKNAYAHDTNPAEENVSYDKYYEDIIAFYKNSIKKKDEWIAKLFWCLAGMILFLLFVLIFDILHPNLGFVVY